MSKGWRSINPLSEPALLEADFRRSNFRIGSIYLRTNLWLCLVVLVLQTNLPGASGQTDDVGTGCVRPQIVYDSITATSNKCGFSEYPGFVSTPPSDIGSFIQQPMIATTAGMKLTAVVIRHP